MKRVVILGRGPADAGHARLHVLRSTAALQRFVAEATTGPPRPTAGLSSE